MSIPFAPPTPPAPVAPATKRRWPWIVGISVASLVAIGAVGAALAPPESADRSNDGVVARVVVATEAPTTVPVTEAPTTTVAPTTTQAPTTTAAPTTTQAPVDETMPYPGELDGDLPDPNPSAANPMPDPYVAPAPAPSAQDNIDMLDLVWPTYMDDICAEFWDIPLGTDETLDIQSDAFFDAYGWDQYSIELDDHLRELIIMDCLATGNGL